MMTADKNISVIPVINI